MSRRLPHKSVCTSPTRLKNLSGDAEVTGTVRYCLAFGTSREFLDDATSTTSEGLCRWAPVGLACTLEAGLPLRQRPRRNPWMRYSYPRVRPNRYDA